MFWTALTKFLASYSDVLGWNFRSSWLANYNPISSVQPDRHSMQLIEIETLQDRLRNRNLFQEALSDFAELRANPRRAHKFAPLKPESMLSA
jgi:hypothetical protein